MKKQFVLAIAFCLPLGVMAQKKGFTIRGKIGTLDAPAKAYLYYKQDDKEITDSAILKKGQFTFKGTLNSPASAEIHVKHDTVTSVPYSGSDVLSLYIENADITITSADSISNATIKGAATNNDNLELRKMQQPYRKTADSLMKVWYAADQAKRQDSGFLKSMRAIMAVTQVKYDSVSRLFITRHPDSYISLRVFYEIEMAYNFNPDTALIKFQRFPKYQQNSNLGKKLLEMIEISQRTNIGRMATDFSQRDTTGKAVKLSDFRGQYVLLDFWASWCKPCRAENPNLLAAYNKYKDKNFTILGVSLDEKRDRAAWLHAVKQDGLPWTQVSDLEGFNAEAAKLYGIKAIPSNFLVDPKGVIVGRNLRGEELQAKLETLLK
ncbi:peroxiredoxin [Chitinophaga terrae (ex Kim and Jung 2007)]|uniref:TlpA disulfide reductase family protein n=1 Tax=Chitinophaga terrae (ex Kim and Jung 2007) TaxID=408074 RepID=UPI0027846C97|nr:TlpA disulfide reductase family protein [Chitinophaga terrae (ex Kim and Jung 2007)]MDQ0109700.1 peroxiredoxin [Chitinophaga terrae (ex Kim and Jung 2007)]